MVTALVIYALAWTLRFLYVMHLRASPLAEVPMLDELYHVEWARALAAGDWLGSEVYFRAPLYPYLLALSFLIFKGSLVASRILQASYGALTPVVVFFLGRRFVRRPGALIAAVAAAVYPFFIYFDNEFLIVSLIVLLDVLLVLAILRADEVPSWGRWLGAGVVMGLSAIARPNVLMFAPFVLLWIWWGEAHRRGEPAARGARVALVRGATPGRTAVLRFLFFLIGVGIVVFPVTLRNYVLQGDPVLIASQGGVNFYIGNNSRADGCSAVVPELDENWRYEDCERIAERQEGRRLKPSEVSAFWYRRGKSFILGSRGVAAGLFLKKLVLFWDRFELANNKDVYYFARMSPIYRVFSWLSFGVIAPLALLGVCVSFRRREGALAALFVFSYAATVVLFFVNARFRLPVVPFLIIFAVAGLFWLAERAKRRDLPRLTGAVAALAVLAVFVNVDFYGTHVGDRAQTHNTIGLAYAATGQYEDAVAEYRRALDLSPGYSKAYNNMGLSLEELGRDEEARNAYTAAVDKNPSNAVARNNLGAYLSRRGDLEAAADEFARAVELDPGMYQAHMNLGTALAKSGDLEAAERHYRSALAVNPGLKEAWNALGVVLDETGRHGEAIAAYTRAVALDPAFSQARNNLGIVLAKTGQYEEALMEFEAALRTAPNDPGIRANVLQMRELVQASWESSAGTP